MFIERPWQDNVLVSQRLMPGVCKSVYVAGWEGGGCIFPTLNDVVLLDSCNCHIQMESMPKSIADGQDKLMMSQTK